MISQAEALARRASLAASMASAASDAADAAAARRDERRDAAAANDKVVQHPMVGDPGLRQSKSKKLQDVDKSWEKVTKADADAAVQAASAPATHAGEHWDTGGS